MPKTCKQWYALGTLISGTLGLSVQYIISLFAMIWCVRRMTVCLFRWCNTKWSISLGPAALGLGRPGALPAGLVQPCPKPRALIHKPWLWSRHSCPPEDHSVYSRPTRPYAAKLLYGIVQSLPLFSEKPHWKYLITSRPYLQCTPCHWSLRITVEISVW